MNGCFWASHWALRNSNLWPLLKTSSIASASTRISPTTISYSTCSISFGNEQLKHDIKDYVEGLKVFWTDTKMWLHWQLAASRPEATESWFPGVGYQKYHGYDEVGRVHYKFWLQTTSRVLDTIIIHFIVTSVHALKSFQNTFLYPTLTMWTLWMTNTDLLQNRSVMSVSYSTCVYWRHWVVWCALVS